MLYRPTDRGLVLASGSPRRRELLSGCGLDFETMVPDVDERRLPGEDAATLVGRLAAEKARAAARRRPEAWVIGADTVVVCGGEILGKPSDRTEARRMLKLLQGREHEVWGGIAVACAQIGREMAGAGVSVVRFAPLSEEEIERYLDSGEPFDKAGAYAIQGVGAALVEAVSGSYTNIVGLDLARLFRMLKSLGALG